MSVSLKRIAELAGVDKSTVSRALAGSSRVKLDTRERICSLAKELSYKPNAVARSLALNKTCVLGVVVPSILGSLIHEIVQGIESVTSKKGYNIILCVSNDDIEKEKTEIRLLTQKRADGLIIYSIAEGDDWEHIRELRDEGVPYVLIDRYFEDLNSDYVGIDNVRGAYEATKHLLELGHGKIGYLTEPDNFTVLRERLEGYGKAHEENQVEIDERLIRRITSRKKFIGSRINVATKSAYEAAMEFFEMKDGPTAIFGINDDIAMGVVLAARDKGLTVPDDVAVVGFDDIQIASLFMVPLTTIAQPKFEMGAVAAEILIDRIESSKTNADDFKRIILEPELIVRHSCGAREAVLPLKR